MLSATSPVDPWLYSTQGLALNITLSAVEITGAASSSSETTTTTSAHDLEPLDYRTSENLWIPSNETSSLLVDAEPPDVSSTEPFEAGDSSSLSGSDDPSNDPEMEEFLLDALCDFDPQDLQSDVLQICI